MKTAIVLIFLSFTAIAGWTQDTSSPESTAREVLRLISSGQEDWEQFRSLFVASATFSVVSDQNGLRTTTFALEDFVRIFLNAEERSFTEKELRVESHQFHGIAQVWQTFEVSMNGNKHRGINALQMVYHNDRWWITNVIWTNETSDISIPDRYLPH
ncbi:MAG: hypothetical protein RL226_1632 [Bacteroidota bacterium]|jgi:hypothetical protein